MKMFVYSDGCKIFYETVSVFSSSKLLLEIMQMKQIIDVN